MRNFFVLLSAWPLLGLLAGCTGSAPRFTFDRPGAPGTYALNEEGVASYYADEFNGRKTSNGEVYDMHALSAAHRTLPFQTRVLVTNLTNGKSVTVRINDRGPFVDDRIIDLSLGAAKAIDMIGPGTAAVSLQVLDLGGSDSTQSR